MTHTAKPAAAAGNERLAFSERLIQALKNARYPASPTRVAREFNVRHDARPVTVHAVRKWLLGEAIPTQDKVQALARWLGVATEWLRFGAADMARAKRAVDRIDADVVNLVADLQRLDEHHKQLACEFVRMLVRASKAPEFAARRQHFDNVAQGIDNLKRDSAAAASTVGALAGAEQGAAA
jgi:transcriptional regulator with XRE-family HTH domain